MNPPLDLINRISTQIGAGKSIIEYWKKAESKRTGPRFVNGTSFFSWRTSTVEALVECFGNESEFLSEFKRVTLGDPTVDLIENGMGILSAIVPMVKQNKIPRKAVPESAMNPRDAVDRVERLCTRFHRVAKKLSGNRRANREPLTVNDEYDVQFLLRALLELEFDDIRAECPTPIHAGQSCRLDFLLPREATIVETKMATKSHRDGKSGDEIILDIARYKEAHPDYKALICFIYDPEHNLENGSGLESDLAKHSVSSFEVHVFVRPD